MKAALFAQIRTKVRDLLHWYVIGKTKKSFMERAHVSTTSNYNHLKKIALLALLRTR